MSDRNRRRAYRLRKKNGRLAIRIDVDEVCWPQKLIALGRLRPDQEDDRAAIVEATIRFLDDVTIETRDTVPPRAFER